MTEVAQSIPNFFSNTCYIPMAKKRYPDLNGLVPKTEIIQSCETLTPSDDYLIANATAENNMDITNSNDNMHQSIVSTTNHLMSYQMGMNGISPASASMSFSPMVSDPSLLMEQQEIITSVPVAVSGSGFITTSSAGVGINMPDMIRSPELVSSSNVIHQIPEYDPQASSMSTIPAMNQNLCQYEYVDAPQPQLSPPIKEEIPITSPEPNAIHAPVVMEQQEELKLQRKRERNRVAASKCRQRKIQKIQNLSKKVDEYKAKNDQLEKFRQQLIEQVQKLIKELKEHQNNGCQIPCSSLDLSTLLHDSL